MSKSFLIRPLLALILLFSTQTSFSAAEKVDMDRMLAGSELVVQATVTSLRAEQNDGRYIHTIVTLNLTDVIKGSWAEPTLDISFLGGTMNGMVLNVGGQKIPDLGQEGVFFIENPLHNQVNPLYGWEQGLFIIEIDPASGEKIVKTAAKKNIERIDFLVDTPPPGISNGIATGIVLQQKSELNTPYTVEQFKASLRTRLEEGK